MVLYDFIKKYNIFILFVFIWFSCSGQTTKQTAEPWSVRMAESVIRLNPEPWMIDFRETPKWEYTHGLVLKAMWEVGRAYQLDKYQQYVLKYYDQFIREDGTIWLYNLEEYNIDRINPGKVLFPIYQATKEEKYKKAIFLLRQQMKTHPRTKEGGFWHKKIYPYQMWLDGLYMAAPFLAEFAVTFDEKELLEEVANQFVWMENHARDPRTGLLYHGWDESKQQRWANPQTGCSASFWGRAMGWYAMGLVDALDYFPADHPRRAELIAILNRLVRALANYQDQESGVWYQVVDQGNREGNYLESSSSCMIVYSMIKGVKKGILDSTFMKVAQRGYAGIIDQFVEVDSTGLVNIHHACAVAGLGGNPYRDGSYEYYISEPIRSNDPKAVGPFMLVSLEFELMK